MKTVVAILCVFMGGSLFAQNTIFAGKITDAGGVPLKDVKIYVKGTGAQAEAKSDELGLYHTQDLPEGDYTVTAMIAKRKASGKVHVAYVQGAKRYYVLRMEENSLNISTTDKNLFMEAKLDRVRKNKEYIDAPPADHPYRTPTNNKEIYYVPKQKPEKK